MDYPYLKEILAFILSIGTVAFIRKMIFKYASTKVEVEIMEDHITLKTNNETLTLSPCLFLSNDHRKKRLLIVGKETIPAEPHIKVNLTKYSGEAGGSKAYYDCVSAFFRYAFCKIIKRRIFSLPKVYLKGAEKLSYTSGDINNHLIHKAFKNAGAVECNFP